MSGHVSQGERGLIFSQGLSWVRWLVEEHGERVLGDIFQALCSSKRFRQATEMVTGSSLKDSIELWKKNLLM